MGIWDTFFKQSSASSDFTSRLHKKVDQLLPEKSQEETLLITCLAGLLARVAFIDFNIDEREKESMREALSDLKLLTKKEVDAVVEISLDEIKDLSGLENHLYCKPICESLSIEERFNILKVLFRLSAADEGSSHQETEEIRQICNSLLLEHKHFVAARATVKDSIDALKKD